MSSSGQACLPSFLFGAELFTLTPGLSLKLERCQSWFLKHSFYVSSFTPSPILLKMSGLNSVASEIAIKKLLFLGRLITEPNMAPTVRNLFQCRAESYFDTNVTFAGVLLSISETLVKYDLFHHGITAPHFHLMKIGKELSVIGSKLLKMMHGCNSATVIQTCILFKPVLKIYLLQIFGP